MNKSKYRLTLNEQLILAAAIASIIITIIAHIPIWVADYKFDQLKGYEKQGAMLAYNSSLRVPDNWDHKKEYCDQFKNLDETPAPSVMTLIDGKYGGEYCGGCYAVSKATASVKYKVYKDKIVYQCKHEIFLTTLIPASLKGK